MLREDSTSVNIWAVDQSFNYTFFNEIHRQSMKDIWDADIKTGTCLFDYIKEPEYRKDVEKNYRSLLAGESHRSIDHFTLETGEEKYFENFGNPIYAQNGRISGYYVLYYRYNPKNRKTGKSGAFILSATVNYEQPG